MWERALCLCEEIMLWEHSEQVAQHVAETAQGDVCLESTLAAFTEALTFTLDTTAVEPP